MIKRGVKFETDPLWFTWPFDWFLNPFNKNWREAMRSNFKNWLPWMAKGVFSIRYRKHNSPHSWFYISQRLPVPPPNWAVWRLTVFGMTWGFWRKLY